MKLLDQIPLVPLVIMALMLGMAPFAPQPHLVEKLGMLMDGTLARPIDIFDLVMHGALPLLLLIKLGRMAAVRGQSEDGG